MGGSSFNFDFTARVQGDVSDVRQKIELIKKQIGNLSLPSGMTREFSGIFDKLEKEFLNFEREAKDGISSMADNKKVQASWGKIVDLMNKAGVSLTQLQGKQGQVFSKDAAKNIQNATKALKEFERAQIRFDRSTEAKQSAEQLSASKRVRTNLSGKLSDLTANKAIVEQEISKFEKTLEKDQADYDRQNQQRAATAEGKIRQLNQEIQTKQKTLHDIEAELLLEKTGKRGSAIVKNNNKLAIGEQFLQDTNTKIQQLEQAKEAMKQAQDELAQIENDDRSKLGNSKGNYIHDKAIKNRQDKLKDLQKDSKEYQKISRELAKLMAEKDQYENWLKEKEKGSEKVAKWQKQADDFEAEIRDRDNKVKHLKELLQTEQNLKQEISSLNKKKRENKDTEAGGKSPAEELAERKQRLAEIQESIETTTNAIEKQNKVISQQETDMEAQKILATADAWKKLQEVFKTDLGVDLGNDARDLEKLQKVIDGFGEADKAKAAEAIKKVFETFNEGTPENLSRVGGILDGINDEVTTLTEKQKDMDRMKQSVLDFFSIGNAIRLFKRSVRDAFETVKDLDKAMTETAVVTDYSIEDMWKKLPKYTKIANELGTTTQGAYETMTLFYQQGLKSDQAFEVGTETMKMARIANMDYAHATNLMTAALRGFNMELNQDSAQRINDVYSELAAITAADTSEIATAMTKTASIANSANMEFETTAALLTQIIETTRESPETAGTALKTVIARFQELTKAPGELLEVDGEKVDANKIEHALRSVGVALRDNVTGQFRDLDDVFLELASKWDTLDTNTQRYIATIAAGSRQQSRFLAMMSNYERTQELIDSAQNSEGAGQAQFEKTLDSLDSKLNKLHNAWDEFAMGLADSSTIKIGTDALTTLLGFINKITDFSGKGTGLMNDLAMPFSEMSKILLTMASIKLGRGLFQGFTGDKGFRGALGEEFATFGNLRATIFDTKEELEAFNAPIQQATKSGEKQLKVAKQRKGVLASELGITQKIGRTALKTLGKTQKFAWAGKMASSGLAAGVTGGLTVAAILAAAAAMWALFKGYKKYFTAGGRLDTAEKVSKNMSSAAEEAKNAYKELDDSLENVQSRLQGIQDLTKGTQEWKDATHEVNAELLKMVEKAPEMAKAITFKDGVGQINNEIASEILTTKKEQALVAQQASLIADQQRFERETDKYYSDIESHASSATGISPGDYQGAIGVSGVSTEGEYFKVMHREASEELSRLIASGEILNVDNAREWAQEHVGKNRTLTDFDQVDFNKMRSRGKELLANDQKNRLQSQQTIDQILDGMDFASNKTKDILGTIDKDLTTKKLKDFQLQALESISKDWKGVYKPTAEQEQAFANSKGWTWVDDDTYINAENEKVSGMRDQAAYYAAAEQAKASYETYASKLGNFIDNLGPTQAQKFSELMSEDGINISTKTLKGLETATTNFKISAGQNGESLPEDVAKMAKVLDGATSLDGDALAKTFGKENFKDLAESLDMSTTELGQELLNNVNAANERINDQRLDITRDLIRVGAADNFEQGLDLYQRLEKSFSSNPDIFRNAYQGLLQSFGDIGDQGLSNTIFGTINKKIESGLWGLESLTKLSTFGTGLDFTNPLSTVRQLKSAARDTTSEIGQLSQEILDSNSALLSGGAQFRHLLKSTDFDAISEDISDIVSETGELNGDDVLALADNYEYLAQVLDETGASAEGLAAALAMVAEGSLSLDEITDTVLAALESYESLDSLVANTLKGIEEFDPGVDENEAAGFISDAFNTLNDNLSRGAYGNSQNKAYMDYLFNTAERKWDEGLTADQRISRMKAARDKFENNTAFMKDLWQNVANNQDFWGTANATNAFTEAGIKVFEDGGEIMVEELVEGSGALTTQNLTSALMKSLGVSEQMANLMITDFKNYGDQDMVDVLNANDKNQAYDAAYQKALETGHVDQREFETIDKFYGEENGGFGAYFEERRRQDMADVNSQNYQAAGQVAITDFYENGALKETTELIAELNKLKQPGDKKWADQFIESGDDNYKGGIKGSKEWIEWKQGYHPNFDKQQPTYDYDAAKTELAELGITGQAAANIINESFSEAATVAKESGQQLEVSYRDAFGEVRTAAVETGQTVEQAIAKQTQTDTFAAQAEAMKKAFSDVEIKFVASTEELDAAQGTLTTIIGADGTHVGIKVSDDGTAAITQGAIDGITGHDVTIGVSFKLKGAGFAGGTKGAPKNEIALTGEEGPELVQSGDSAYVTGQDGPQLAYIHKGDQVYTAGETKKILNGQHGKTFGSFRGGTKSYGFGGYGDAQIPEDDKPSHNGGNSSSKKKDKDEKPWKNPYDALYNLIRQIDEEMRKRNRIERAYQKELKNINLNAKKLAQNTKELMEQLLLEKGANEERIKRRKDQIRQYQAKNSKYNKYGSIDENGNLRINWELIDSVKDSEEGKNIEEYISQLEEWADDINSAEDAINDIEDQIEEIKEQRKQSYLDFEDEIKDALLKLRQDEIDELSAINQNISDSNSRIISAMEKSISKMRQDRQNEKTEQDLQEKYRRLAYLSQDSSNANDLEIFNTEEGLKEAEENYTDELVDQKISQLQDQNDLAAQQREKQITILQSQLEHYEESGEVYRNIESLIRNSIASDGSIIMKSELASLLKQASNWDGLSETMKADWEQKYKGDVAQAFDYLTNKDESFEADMSKIVETVYKPKEVGDGSSGGSSGSGGGGGSGGSSGTKPSTSPGSYSASAQWTHYYHSSGSVLHYSDTMSKTSTKSQADAQSKADTAAASASSESYRQACNAKEAWDRQHKSNPKPQSKPQKSDIDKQREQYEQANGKPAPFKTGGLADYTGPAWLDGTRSRPELVLNAQDTRNFIQLKDILSNLLGQGPTFNSQNNGEISYDIDINVEKISDDYDVDQIADRIRRLILTDAKYRNNNIPAARLY